ncbi:MAG: VWA domain-containing protein [Phycisphaeraceae bacterium]|nr:VWA domain-containing protein [Phycisphaeraceae bacterium]
MSIRFDQPVWLLLLALSVPVAVIGVRWLTGMSPVRRATAIVARVVLVALVSAMLAGATAVRTTERLAVVAVVDVSGSVRRLADQAGTGEVGSGDGRRALEAVRHFLEAAAADRKPDDLLGIVVFDSSAVAVATPTRADVLQRSLDVSTGEGSNIGEALRFAAALFPPDATRRIVLFSDGNETAGRAMEAAKELSASAGLGGVASAGRESGGVVVDVVPIAYHFSNEVVVEAVEAPPTAPPEGTINVRVVLSATSPASGVLRLLNEGEEIDINGAEAGSARRVTLAPGRSVESIAVKLDASRVHRFEAIFEPDAGPTRSGGAAAYAGDTVLTNNRAESFTITAGRGSVLVVDGVSGGDAQGAGATLARTLSGAGIDVETVAPAGLPGDPLSLQAYDLVILQNVAADALPRNSHALLASYVSDQGGGLIMVGGPDSFGAGGWKGSDLEAVLPVRLDLPEKLVVPAAAIVLVLDDSGSMSRSVMGSSRTQQEVANEGAALAVQSLDRTDMVGVIAFNSDYVVLVPLDRNTEPDRTCSIIRSIRPDGGTEIGPALEEAFNQLKDAEATVRHVILLTDGVSGDRQSLPDLAVRMKEEGISLSTIAVGDGADAQTLQVMADRGGGAFYRVTDPSLLPRIFLKAVRVVRTPLIREAPFTPVVLATGSPVTEGVGAGMPPLRGLVLTQPRPERTVTLAMTTPTGEPLLAYWNAGLGRVAAFTSDAHSKWAQGWIGWPGYRRMWTQLEREIARPATDRTAELTTEVVGDSLRLRLDAADKDGRPLDLLSVPAKVYGPDGKVIATQLAQTAPGVYEGSVQATGSGNYVAVLTPRQGTRRLPPVLGGASRASGVEFRALSSNIGLLRDVAGVTGGRVYDLRDPSSANLFDRTGVRPSEARQPLWRPLLLWTIIVLLMDVATRRIAWDRFFSSRYGADVKAAAADAVRDRGARAAAALSSLRGAPAAAPAGGALSTDDARRIVAEQARRRKEERAAAARGGTAAGAGAASAAQAPRDPGEAGQAEDRTSGLMAAKLRAKRQFEERKEGGAGGAGE